MNEWKRIESHEDIRSLLEEAGGFHDCCLAEAHYRSGAYVDEGKRMHMGQARDRVLTLVFHSQWKGQPLELRFAGVRRYAVRGWEPNHSCEIFDCTLTQYQDLILWADWAGFDLTAPEGTYVLAETLEWRWTHG